MQPSNRLVANIFVLAVFSLVGCGEQLYPVKGKVMFEGKPMLGGGSITFMPQGTDKLREAGAEIKEDGTFELTTAKPGDGAIAGDYRVVIRQTTEKEGANVGDNGKAGSRAGLSLPKEDRIHTKYADPYNSPLTAKVEAKSPSEITFQLKRE